MTADPNPPAEASSAWLDRLVVQRLREAGGEELRRARVTAAAALLVLGSQAVGVAYSMTQSWLLPLVATGAGVLISGVALAILWRVGGLLLVGNLLAAALVLTSGTISAADRGVLTPLLFGVVAAPLVATFVAGRRWGGLWIGIAVALIGGLFLGGAELAQAPGLLTDAERPLNAAMILTVLCLVVGLLGIAFETAKSRAQDELRGLARAEEESRRSAEQANQMKSAFLANVSHELRTPLNAIIGYSEMLADDAEDEDQAEDLRQILHAGTHLLSLINDLLDISRIEAGRMEVRAVAFELAELLADVVPIAEQLATQNGNELIVDAPSRPVTLHTDIKKVRQILLNLIGNAAKFTDGGTVRLTARAVRDQGVAGVEWVVSDTGIGMTDDQAARVFGSFVQADSGVARKYGGAGLGLRISIRLAQLLGGDISVQSRESEGSVFTLHLPTTAPSGEGRGRDGA